MARHGLTLPVFLEKGLRPQFDELRAQGERGDQDELTKMDLGNLERTEMAGASAAATTRFAARCGNSARLELVPRLGMEAHGVGPLFKGAKACGSCQTSEEHSARRPALALVSPHHCARFRSPRSIARAATLTGRLSR